MPNTSLTHEEKVEKLLTSIALTQTLIVVALSLSDDVSEEIYNKNIEMCTSITDGIESMLGDKDG